MSETPDNLHYARTHEWVRIEADRAIVGITDYAQEQLGDIVYIEPPDMELEVEPEDEVTVIESVKAASDIYAPVAGTVAKWNDNLEEAPETVNEDPYGDGWLFELRLSGDLDTADLLSAEEYQKFCEEEDE